MNDVRNATDNDVRKIKKGDIFLVDTGHDKIINVLAAENARYNGVHWYVEVQTFAKDVKTGAVVKCGKISFDDRNIVVINK